MSSRPRIQVSRISTLAAGASGVCVGWAAFGAFFFADWMFWVFVCGVFGWTLWGLARAAPYIETAWAELRGEL